MIWRISYFREFWSSVLLSVAASCHHLNRFANFYQNLIKEQKPPRHLHSSMLHEGEQVEKEDSKPHFQAFSQTEAFSRSLLAGSLMPSKIHGLT